MQRVDAECAENQMDADWSAKHGKPDKIVPLPTLQVVCAELRASGQRIVLCHGVFDLIHIGHLRHLKHAREHGDVLVVSITADRFVNKGPDRPVFQAALRCEVLAGLEFVDYVTVVDEPSAAPAIRAVKPHYYVKGSEYAEPKGDVTGKIQIERDMVESEGGELVFTDDITFSSSNLLNRHFGVHDEAVRSYLDTLRDADLERRIKEYFDHIEQMKIVIVGESVIDRYVYVAPMGKAAKENIIATLYKGEEVFAGGVVAAANHLAAICPNVELITLIGDPNYAENHEALVRERLSPSIQTSFVYRPNGPTVEKTRFVEPTYVRKLFEVYTMDDRPIGREVEEQFHDLLAEKLRSADLAIVCDFGHGFISQATIDLLESEARFLAVNAQSNAGNIGYNIINKYRRADFVCIDAMEAWLAVRDKHAELADVTRRQLPALVTCPNFIVTHGKAGCFATDGAGDVVQIPAFANAAIDTIGAGDAFFVTAAPMLAAGADCPTAGFMGNVSGAISIGIVGHRSYLTKLEIQRYVTTLLK